MKSSTALVLLMVAVIASGCTSIQVSQDYDLQADRSLLGTWQWRYPRQPATGDIRVDNPLLDKRIRRAVETHLARRNIVRVDADANLVLSYHLDIARRIRNDTVTNDVGLWGYRYPWYGGMGTETRITEYDQSDLIIDIHAADTREMVWRGVGSYRYRSYDSPQAAAEAMQAIVDKILAQFPPNG
jgi:hypothetical protein